MCCAFAPYFRRLAMAAVGSPQRNTPSRGVDMYIGLGALIIIILIVILLT